MEDVAREYGISQSRTSQIRMRALRTMREAEEEAEDEPGEMRLAA